MKTSVRTGAIDRIYIHTNEGPESEHGAAALVSYLAHEDGGYNVVVDDNETIVAAADNLATWAEGGDNAHALSVCIIGYASQTAEQWNDPYSHAATLRAAQQVATWCVEYNVPVEWVTPGAPGQAPTGRGIAEHADDHSPYSQGHTDPGLGFNRDAFIVLVKNIVNPPAVVDWSVLKKLAAWEKAVAKTPLKRGDEGPNVALMNALLLHQGVVAPDCQGSSYGQHSSFCVTHFKSVKSLSNHDGDVCGADCAKALLAAK